MGIKINKEKEKCTWISDDLKIAFSKPNITALHDNKITSLSQAMYFEYNVKVSVKTHKSYKSSHRKWKKEFELFVGDFPSIDALQQYLKLFIEDNVPESLVTTEYLDSNKEDKLITYSWTNESVFIEDVYTIKKFIRYRKKEPNRTPCKEVHYNLGVGYCDYLKSNFIRMVNSLALTETQMCDLLSCIDAFIEMGIENYNAAVTKNVDIQTHNKCIEDNILYVNTDNNADMELYCCGDVFRNPSVVVNIKTTHNDLEVEAITGYYRIASLNKEFNQVVFQQVTWNQTKKEWTVVEDSPLIVYVDALFDIGDFMIEYTDYLKYSLDDIVSDFANLLKQNAPTLQKRIEEDKKGTKHINIDKYYVWLILNRYWMCRDEHPYSEKKPKELETEKWVRRLIVDNVLVKLYKELK